MKKLQSIQMSVKFGDKGKWQTYWYRGIRYEEEKHSTQYIFTFEEYCRLIETEPNGDFTNNSDLYKTMFKHRPIIIYRDFFNTTYNKKQAPIIYFKKDIFVCKNYTMQDLIEYLPNQELLEYLKDNGIHFCPMRQE